MFWPFPPSRSISIVIASENALIVAAPWRNRTTITDSKVAPGVPPRTTRAA